MNKAENLKSLSEVLWKEPSDATWIMFVDALKKSNAKYYSITYPGKNLSKAQDLRKAYAEIYDSKNNVITRVPIYRVTNRKIEGATVYLSGLHNANMVIK
jgi:hypothetical protein